ncbi:MAG: YihY/virulence factor BrkB family protein [Fusobacteriaceae bacterium]
MFKNDLKYFILEFLKEGKISNLYRAFKGALKNYKRANSSLWVNSLCYISILSLVPLLAIGFSIGRWLGIDDYLAKQLYLNSPLNEETLGVLLNASTNLLNNTRSGLLAGIGFIFLGWAIISMFSLIEKSLNSIWRIKKQRALGRRFSDYLTVFMVFPLTILSMNILTGNGSKIITLPPFINIIAPYLSLWAFFFIFYMIMPNTKIRLVPAIISSFFISLLFNQSNVIFLKLQILITEYNKIYGSFSIILIFLIWLKIIWFLILLGSHLTYFLQNNDTLLNIDGIKYLNFNTKFKLTTIIVIILTKNFVDNEPPITTKEISSKTHISLEIVNELLVILRENNFILSNLDVLLEESTHKLSINYEKLTLKDIYIILENFGDTYSIKDNLIPWENKNTKIMDLI